MGIKAHIIKLYKEPDASYYIIPDVDIPDILRPFIDYDKLERERAPKHVELTVDNDLYVISKEPFKIVEVMYDYSVRIYNPDEVEIPDDLINFLREDVKKLLTE